MTTKYIFVTGGVVSSLGKGIISASLAKLLQARGYKVTIQKFDPYINIDPGTLNPYEHGEVFVTEDGAETDLDLGHYERFTDIPPIFRQHVPIILRPVVSIRMLLKKNAVEIIWERRFRLFRISPMK